jgi:purine-nucleoside phosphorylase
MLGLLEKIESARTYIQERVSGSVEIGIILGTGLGSLANRLEVEAEIPYGDIPYFVQPTVDGHAGKWICGKLAGKKVAVLQGRLHFYEGHSMADIAFPVRVLKALGARALVVTNISGGINPTFKMGDLMAITDHINFLGTNPLIGVNHEALGPRFPDMSDPYHKGYVAKLMTMATEKGLVLRQGVYACMSGPCLETAAEYRMLRILGADAVGMSTVPEVIAAIHVGLKVAAMSIITDICDPDQLKPINIPEIMRVVGESEPKLANFIEALVENL